MRVLSWTPFFKAPVPQQLQGEFRKLVFVGASPTRGSNFKSGSWCNSSIFAREANGPGANPGFLTIKFRWAEVDRLSSTIRRAYRPWRKPWRSGFDSRHWSASVRSRHLPIRFCGTTKRRDRKQPASTSQAGDR